MTEQEIQQMKVRAAALEQRIAEMKTEAAALEQRIAEMKAEATAQEQSITVMKTQSIEIQTTALKYIMESKIHLNGGGVYMFILDMDTQATMFEQHIAEMEAEAAASNQEFRTMNKKIIGSFYFCIVAIIKKQLTHA